MTQHFGDIVARKDNLSVIYCQLCHFRHLHPIPDTKPLYSGGVYHSQVKPSMTDDYNEDIKWWDAVHSDWLSMITPHMPNALLLDVGSGTGHFLDSAHKASLIPTGIEPDFDIGSRRQDVMWAEYKDINSNQWGCISAHWVLEHLQDPIHFLDWARQRLATDGILLITIPNDFTNTQMRAMLAVNKPWYWIHHTHINYWPAESFPSFLDCHGFKVISAYGSWQPEQYLLDGKNYLNDHNLGRKLHHERVAFDLEVSAEYRRSKYLLFGHNGMGRDVTFCSVKV